MTRESNEILSSKHDHCLQQLFRGGTKAAWNNVAIDQITAESLVLVRKIVLSSPAVVLAQRNEPHTMKREKHVKMLADMNKSAKGMLSSMRQVRR
jgi:hypothetical protein